MGSASQLVLENVIRVRSANSDPNHNMAHANCGLWILCGLMDLAVDGTVLTTASRRSRRKR
jgi:hypothetical protein